MIKHGTSALSAERIVHAIVRLRGHKAMLDEDLANSTGCQRKCLHKRSNAILIGFRKISCSSSLPMSGKL